MMRWGLIPSWAKDPAIGNRMINARCETVHEKPAFRAAIRFRRCVIPANGFYEWMEEGGKKHPLYISMKDGSIMGFAGIWDHWKTPDGENLESCSILTTNSNPLIQPIHDRMPVILDAEHCWAWLEDRPVKELQGMLRPYSSEKMAQPVKIDPLFLRRTAV